MDNATINQKIKEILVEEFEVDEKVISRLNPFRESLDFDNMDYADLMVIIESHFGVKLVNADLDTIATFQSLYDTIEQKMTVKDNG